jgi:hypothetical protein
VVPTARSPDAGIEPASGEAGWKAGAPSRPAGKPALPVGRRFQYLEARRLRITRLPRFLALSYP